MLLKKRRRKSEPIESAEPEPRFDTSVLYSTDEGALALGVDPQIGYRGANPLEALDDDQFGRWWDDRKRQADILREDGVDWVEGVEATEHDPYDQHGVVAMRKDFKRRQKVARKAATT